MVRRGLRWAAIGAVVVLGAALHWRAVERLPIDYDEDDYLAAAQRYARFLRAGDVAAIVNYDYNFEHPPLTKLAYGAVLLALPPAPDLPETISTLPPARSLPQPHFSAARRLAAAFGSAEVAALAIANPLAGFFLAIHTWQLKYTSQVMLEPLPALTSALAVLLYVRWRQPRGRPWPGWLALSAVALGLTAASKYTYCVAGVAVLVDWLWATYPGERPRTAAAWARWLGLPLLWGLLAVAVFFAANPRLWSDPLGRLRESLLYHGSYAVSQHVQNAGYPAWQPFVWLSGPVPWHPGVFVLTLDLFISLLALAGARRLWQRQRVFALWLGLALLFLLWWNTKWPQYILILTAPLSLAAAEGFRAHVWEPLQARWQNRGRAAARQAEPAQLREAWRALPWLLPGLLPLLLLTLFPLVYQAALALTDTSLNSLRDAISGGVWREVWLGLTGQREAVQLELFAARAFGASEVRYAGPGRLLALLTGLAPDVVFFNVMWTVLTVGLQLAVGVGAALLLNRPGVRFRGGWQALFILPWAIPEFVGALVWVRMFSPTFGWLTHALPPELALPAYFEDKNLALLLLLVAATWYGFPLMMVAAAAGLKFIPADVYDAAALDGAGTWARLRHVTWPMLLPLLVPAILVRSIFAFNQFYLFWVMEPPFPLITLATGSYAVFSNGGQYALSAAINVVTVVVLILLLLWFNRGRRVVEGVTYA